MVYILSDRRQSDGFGPSETRVSELSIAIGDLSLNISGDGPLAPGNVSNW